MIASKHCKNWYCKVNILLSYTYQMKGGGLKNIGMLRFTHTGTQVQTEDGAKETG